jgi:pimeloyl-ACP methyl ester carboxylesterase
MPTGSARPPSLRLMASELAALPKLALSPFRRSVDIEPFGDGRPVLVIPGMLATDSTTALLRGSLEGAGFVPYGWGRMNTGVANDERLTSLRERLRFIAEKHTQPVIIIGWSLGGLFARVLAQRTPQSVAMVMTLGSPFSGDPHANNAWRLYERLNDHTVDAPPFPEALSAKPPVRTVAVWSQRDGVIAPECARGEIGEADRAEEMDARHLEMTSSRRAVKQIIDVLQSEIAE